jgi:2-polyprenyl-3-methyl-5-hydroxy-6-metoxy-1,4-benzoquinol methylase
MSGTNQWEEFFDSHAPSYMENSFTGNTVAEVDFILEELGLPLGSRILDVGCGTGRHAIELARRGYDVTGIDISAGMLSEAEKAASVAGVSIRWIRKDATEYKTEEQFDAAICLCEGGFCLLDMEDDAEEHDRAILRNISAALPEGAWLLMTTLNGYRKIRGLTQADVGDGHFDPLTMVHHLTEELDLPDGKRVMTYKERLYILPELVKMLESEGFRVEEV